MEKLRSRRIIRARYSQQRDSVDLYWKGKNVMSVLRVSETYAVDGLTAEETADVVLKDVKEEATDIINEYVGG